MSLYFIEYDLRNPGQSYSNLIEAIQQLDGKRMLASLWCVERRGTSAIEIRDYLRRFMDTNDGLAVAEVTSWATWRTKATPQDLGRSAA